MLLNGHTIGSLLIGLVVVGGLRESEAAGRGSKVDVDGKVVLANIDKHPVTFRIGKSRKQIAPQKATVLSPKKYPVAIEVWSGARQGGRWERQTIASAGIYALQYSGGLWRMAKKPPKPSKPGAAARRAPQRNARPRPSYRRSTGSPPRIVRRTGRPYYRPVVPVIGRVAASALWLYALARDEADRDLIRDIIIGEEIDQEIEDAIWERLDDEAVNLPAHERESFFRAMQDLRNLSDSDLRELDNATEEDWDQAREYLGDQVTDNAWQQIESDFANIDTDMDANDISAESDAGIGGLDLDEAGIESLDSNIDLGDLDGGDLDLGAGDMGGMLGNLDYGDLGGGLQDIDIGDLGTDFSGLGGDGMPDFSSQLPDTQDGGDFQGGFGGGFDGGFGGGGFDAGGFDPGDFGGGFGYDMGGFGGGFGGGFDMGGGFDGGGFDMGGGFDDFGGGFDF